jgi:glycosyltransferase involved in cell wall biosynthesis
MAQIHVRDPVLKILHIEAGEKMLGGAQQVIYLLAGQSPSKHQHIFLCPDGSDVMRHASERGLNVIGMKMWGDIDPGFTFRLYRLIKFHSIDLLIIHSRRGADFYGGMAARLAGIRSILVRRVDNPEARLVTKLKYRLYDKTVAISDAIGHVLRSQGLRSSKIEVIKDCVDSDLFAPASASVGDLSERLGIPENKLTVGVVAQLIPRKGHAFLWQTAPEILRRVPNVHFVFLGAGGSRQTLEQQVSELNLGEHVTFTGFRDDIHRIIPQLDIVAHPALMEGMGVALLQSSSAGVPVVAFSAGGIPEVVEHNKTGFLAPTGDAESLKSSLITLLESETLRSSFGRRGREKIVAEFSIQNMQERYESLYDRVATGAD